MNLYIDCEFDAVRVGRTHQQCVVSIGAIAYNDKNDTQQTFYTLIKPRNFKRVTRVVAKMTQLGDDEILKARSFGNVMRAFEAWIKKRSNEEEYQLYSFGPDDKRTILSHAKYEDYGDLQRMMKMQDLQKILSQSVRYQNQVISMTLSLDDLKYVYALDGEVVHNALNDARDLMRIHQAYLSGIIPEVTRVEEVWKRKEEKRLLVLEKQRTQMLELIKSKYAIYDNQRYDVEMRLPVVEELEFLEGLQHPFHMQFYQDHLKVENKLYYYRDIQLKMNWFIRHEQPYVSVVFQVKEEIISYVLELNYRNASILEGICMGEIKEREE